MEDIDRGAVPVLIKLTACFTDVVPVFRLAKLKAVSPKVNPGTGTAVPVAPNSIDCGESLALSVMTTDTDAAPAATGMKLTNTVHLWPAANVGTQAFRSVNSSACAPTRAMDEIERGALPVFSRVTGFGLETVPTG